MKLLLAWDEDICREKGPTQPDDYMISSKWDLIIKIKFQAINYENVV